MIISARISGAALCFALLSSLPQRNEIMRTEYFFFVCVLYAIYYFYFFSEICMHAIFCFASCSVSR